MRVSRLQNLILEEKMSDRQFPWVIWRCFFILYPKKTSEITGKLPEMIVWLPNAKYVSLSGNVAKFEQIFGPKFDSLVLEFFRFFLSRIHMDSRKWNFAWIFTRIDSRIRVQLLTLFWKIVGWNYWTHVFNKDIEILYLAEICKYMNTPHFRTDLGPTLDWELLTKITSVC